MSESTATFEGKGGLALHLRTWRPDGAPRATLIVQHGLKDHGARYGELAARMVARGFAVYAADLRGHGASAGDRVWIDSFDDYLDDLDVLVKRVETADPGLPRFHLGHSMGGAIVTLHALERKPALAGLVTHAAALGVRENALTVFGTKLIAAIAPRAKVFQLKLEKFSRDPAVVAAAKADPLVHHPAAPARTAREVIGAIARIRAASDRLDVPLLALHGTADQVTPPEGTQELHARAKSADKTLKLYEGLVHDLVHEPEKETVLADIVEWLSARVR